MNGQVEGEIKILQRPNLPFIISLVAGFLMMVVGIWGLLSPFIFGIILVPELKVLIWLASLLELIGGIIIFVMAFILYVFPRHAFLFKTFIIAVFVCVQVGVIAMLLHLLFIASTLIFVIGILAFGERVITLKRHMREQLWFRHSIWHTTEVLTKSLIEWIMSGVVLMTIGAILMAAAIFLSI